ncbi:zinc finger, CCHC-type containing protein, partial [Tanacetum coccineum]
SMLEREKPSGSNFNDWFRLLRIVLLVEKKLNIIEQPIPPAPVAGSTNQAFEDWNTIYDVHNEELKSMFEKQVRVKRFDLIQTFHACKQEEGKSISSYVLKMEGYVEQLERLGCVFPQEISIGLILNDLTSLPKKAATPQFLTIQGGRIQKPNKKPQAAKGKGKGKGKGKNKLVYAPKPKNPKLAAKEHLVKDDACHHCKEVGHWKRNCPVYLAELTKKKKQVGIASTLGLKVERKLKQGVVYLTWAMVFVHK